MEKRDYYEVLGVPQNATDDQIKKAYRKLAMQYHPDCNPGKEQWANDRFKEINEAYEVLSDPDKRRYFDRFGVTAAAGDISGEFYADAGFEALMRHFGGGGFCRFRRGCRFRSGMDFWQHFQQEWDNAMRESEDHGEKE